MNRLFIIIRREYFNIVGRKSFIVMTLLIPVLSLLCMAAPVLLMGLNDSDQKIVVVIDEGAQLADVLEDTEEYRFVRIDSLAKKNPRTYYEQNSDSVYAMVVLPGNLAQREFLSVFSEKPVQQSLVSHLKDTFDDVLTKRNIDALGIPDIQEKVKAAQADVNVSEIRWSESGEEETSGSAIVAQVIGLVFAMFSYMFVLIYGAMIMNGVIEEKTNRIVEVIVSSCKPIELMLGKIIGIALVGITQMCVWGVLTFLVSMIFGFSGLLTGASDATATINAMSASGTAMPEEMADVIRAISGVNFGQLLCAFVFFGIGGYLLYGSLFAAFGSAADQPSDASQFTTPVIMIEIFALYAGMACMENPDGSLAMWCSFIPFTSSIVMMVRLPYGVPMWELLTSIVLLYSTALLILWLAGRIYRRGILMYGKKMSFLDIFRWIK